MDIIAGTECKFFEWNGASHDEFHGIITNVLSGNPLHPNVTLRYSSGAAAPVAANVVNIESLGEDTSGVDYWRPNRVGTVFIEPRQILEIPAQGQIIWVFVYDATDNENYEHVGFVRSVVGIPAIDSNVNVTVFDPGTGDAENVNQVRPYTDFTSPADATNQQENYWCDRNLGPGDESFA